MGMGMKGDNGTDENELKGKILSILGGGHVVNMGA